MMRSLPSSVVAVVFLGAMMIAPGCSSFGSDDDAPPPGEQPPPADGDGGTGPKAPPVGGPANTSELTEALGVFVANNGADNGDGTRGRPLARIQAAIDLAKTVGKRVYVCAGTYLESLVLADSISIIGGLTCAGGTWEAGAGVSRIEAPASPAVRASNIQSPTRLEGLDIVAPSATAPSGSSIGLIAARASALVVARSKITSGDAMKGDDGVEGVQLANAGTTRGGAIPGAAQCLTGGLCGNLFFVPQPGANGGTNICVGAPGHVGGTGGKGGTGGVYEVIEQLVGGQPVALFFASAGNEAKFAPIGGPTGAAGADSPDGVAPPASGSFSENGYAPADGNNGTDGAPGSGGAGGNGLQPGTAILTPTPVGAFYRGWGGGGGGAGGCPGLAGTAGKGGGASVAALLIESPVTFDGVQLASGKGGDAGRGTLGSTPLAGGLRNNQDIPGVNPTLAPALGHDGGRGGAAGISSNGTSGPSAGIAHVGAGPKLTGDTKATPGQGGAAIAVQSRTDGFGITKTVPATVAGVSKDVLAL